ncbi:MAG: hypothetical protein ACLQVL_37045 [Terriglobia bacterium]
MDKQELERALTRLGQLLRERRVAGEVAVFGGAAIVLGFDFRDATQNVDAMITQGHGQVVKAQEEVGVEMGLPPNWLDEQGTRYLSKHNDFEMFKTYPSEGQFGLRVLTATPQYLLAMKLLSFRSYGHDIDDIVQLARRLGCTSADDLLQLVKHYYPDEQVLPEKTLEIQSIARQIHAPHKP